MAKRNVAHKGFAAAIDEATVRRMDEGANAAIRGQQRRLTLITCARDSDTLINLARNEPEAFGQMADMVMDYYEHTAALMEIATSALARIEAADELARISAKA